jgi:hypothetical protein
MNQAQLEKFAREHYDNPHCAGEDEFQEDFQRLKCIKKNINRYLMCGEISERLLLNHIVILFNVFGIEPTKTMLDEKMDDDHWPILKACLLFLGYTTEGEYSQVELDPVIVSKLRELK